MMHIEVGRGEKKCIGSSLLRIIKDLELCLRRVLIPVLDQHTASVG